MKLTNFGGATAILEHQGKRVLFDPWLDDGIYYGSWFHYPPVELGPQDIGRLDYVYISHIHEDHCSAGTIKHINRDAEIVVMDREPQFRNFVTNFLRSSGFEFKKVHCIPPQTPTEIAPGLIADMVEADTAHEYNFLIDSGLILKWDDFVVYNANDCPPCSKGLNYIKQEYGKVDLALLPYAGGSGYPSCYTNLSEEEKREEKQRIYQDGIQMFINAIQELHPRYSMPFADQYVVAGSRSDLNKYAAHPPCPGVVSAELDSADVKDKLLLLNSNQSFDFETENKVPNVPYRFFTESDREDYIHNSLQDKLYDHELITMSDSVSLDRLVSHARARLWSMQKRQRYFPDFSYYLEDSDGETRYQIDFTSEDVQKLDWKTPLREPYLKVTASRTLFVLMLINHISWNLADAGFFLDYERVPNVYNTKLQSMLNHLII